MSEQTFTDSNFEGDVLGGKGIVVVDFFAPWCGPCKMMAPVIDKLATEYEGKVVIGKLDIDVNPQASQKYEVQSIPTVIFFKDGQVVEKLIGFQSEEQLRQKIDSLL